MGTQPVQLPWGGEEMTLELPEDWELAGILKSSPRSAVTDPTKEAEQSLSSPLGMPRLKEIARPGMKIVLVVDDSSRPTPVASILPAVLAELQQAGVSLEQITIIAALGVHRPMTDDELSRRIGMPPLQANLRYETHDCDDTARLAYLGTTHRGTPVHLNKTVAEADLVISIGCIEPHVIASFGGGYKSLLPGVASRITIAHNHALNCRPDTFLTWSGSPSIRTPCAWIWKKPGRC